MTWWAIQQAVYTRLADQLSVPVYDHAPQDVMFPYVELGEIEAIPFDTDDSIGSETTVTIHSWSRYRGWKEIKEIQAKVYDALHRYNLPVSGAHLITVEFEIGRTFLDADGLTRHGVQEFRIITEKE